MRLSRHRSQSKAWPVTKTAFFAFDIAEAAQIRRIQSVRSLGHDVASVSFRRANMNAEFQPDWPDLPMGTVENNDFVRRALRVCASIFRVWRKRHFLDDHTVWIARNFDLLAIACAVRFLSRRKDVKIVYECLDIHGLFTRDDAVGKGMRWLERRMLAQIALLIISSPGFERHYFSPVQGYSGPTALIENKLWLGDAEVPRPAAKPAARDVLTLGWVGSLRCKDSLAILVETASQMGDRLQLRMHGNVHSHAIPDFQAQIEAHENISYHGAYAYPHGLAEIYSACDLVWAQDLWQRGANSDWLLPNRIYEASYFGCPQIAVAGTETGRRMEEAGLGYTVPEATPDALISLLKRLDFAKVASLSAELLEQPDRAFRLTPEDIAAHLAPVLADGTNDYA